MALLRNYHVSHVNILVFFILDLESILDCLLFEESSNSLFSLVNPVISSKFYCTYIKAVISYFFFSVVFGYVRTQFY